MKRKNRILAFILALIMLVSAMPLTLLAVDADTVNEEHSPKSTLDLLADKATGELYTAPTVTGNSSVASVERDGYWNANGAFTNNADSGLVLKDFAAEQQFTYDADGGSFAAGNAFISTITLKRGEAMPEGFDFIFYKTNTKNWLQFGAILHEDSIVFTGHVKNHWQSNSSLKAAFSTAIDTTVTMIYDNPSGKMSLYVNGILIDCADYKWSGEVGHGSIYTEKLTTPINGEIMTLGKMSLYSVASASADAFVTNSNPANGVFEIDGDYYYFENGIPVLGKTIEVDGYNIVTEANTGKITECFKPQDNSGMYERWTAADYAKTGVSLVYNGYGTSFSAPVEGYVCETVTEGDTTYYLVDPTKRNVREYYIIGTDVGDGFEISKKARSPKTYFKSLPESYETVIDKYGNTRYKTTTAPTGSISLDLSYTHEFTSATETSGAVNINVRFKFGPNISTFETTGHADILSFNYYLDGTNTRVSLGSQKKVEDGSYHLFIGDVDCGIVRSDIYTEITIRSYIVNSKVVYDLYVNGVKMAESVQMFNADVTKYRPAYLRFYAQNYLEMNEPFITYGATQVYYGDKVNDNTNPFSGTKMTSDGVCTYENGIVTKLVKGTSADSTVGMKSYSVTLGETLGLNFYTSLPKNADKAVITVGNKKSEIDLTKLTAEANGFYKLSAKVSSINVAENVFVTFYDTDGKVMPIYASNGALYDESYFCSVKGYAEQVAEKARIFGDATVELVKAMLNYAAYAENYFGKNNTFDTAYSAEYAESVKALDAASMVGTVSANEDPLEIVRSMQLVLDNATKIRINLKAAATVTSEYGNVKYVESDGKYYIDICDIDARNLDTVYTLSVDGIEIAINVLGIARIVATSPATYGENYANLMKAIYLYSLAADSI